MLDRALELAFCGVLQQADAFSECHFFTGLATDVHEMPAITVVSKSEGLAGSMEVFRSELQIIVDALAHATSPEKFAELVNGIRRVLAAKESVVQEINSQGKVYLCGYALVECEESPHDDRLRTVVTLKAGYRVPAN